MLVFFFFSLYLFIMYHCTFDIFHFNILFVSKLTPVRGKTVLQARMIDLPLYDFSLFVCFGLFVCLFWFVCFGLFVCLLQGALPTTGGRDLNPAHPVNVLLSHHPFLYP